MRKRLQELLNHAHSEFPLECPRRVQDFRFISALGAVFFAVIGLAACGGGIPGNAVVQVNGTPITKATFEHWMSVAAGFEPHRAPGRPRPSRSCPIRLTTPPASPTWKRPRQSRPRASPSRPRQQLKSQCEQQYKSLQQEVLGFLISSAWVLGEAESLGVKVSDAEVKKEFEKIKNEQFPKPAEFEKFLATSGQTVSDLLLRVKLNMLSSKIQQKVAKEKATVSKAEIKKYYEEHKSQYGTPEKRNVRIILTKTEAQANKAKKEIESGKSFASVAKSNSIDPTSKDNGGELTGRGQRPGGEGARRSHLLGAQGQARRPVKTPFGYYIYEVTAHDSRQPAGAGPGRSRDQTAARPPSSSRRR